MELHDYFSTIRKRWATLVLGALLGAAVGFGLSALQPDMFRASSSVFVASQRGETVSELVQGSQFTQSLMQSYAELARLPIVLQPVIDKLGLDQNVEELANKITAEAQLSTVIIRVDVSDRSAQQAAVIADAVIASLADAARTLPPHDANNQPTVVLTAVSPAAVPRAPYAPSTTLNIAAGTAIGFILALVYAVLKELLDTRVRSARDIYRVADVAVLGLIPRNRKRGLRLYQPRSKRAVPATLATVSAGQVAEAYRRLAVNLEFASIDSAQKTLVITSASAGEGKTTTAINLALALAERKQRVLLVDADLRKPRIAEVCGIDGSIGLTSVLIGERTLADSVQQWSNLHIDVLTSGPQPPNPSQLISSRSMEATVDEMREKYDVIVIDSPPLLPVSDSLTLAHLAEGALVVARHKSTRRQQLARALEGLNGAGARTLGVVLNDLPQSPQSDYYGYAGTSAVPVNPSRFREDPAESTVPQTASWTQRRRIV